MRKMLGLFTPKSGKRVKMDPSTTLDAVSVAPDAILSSQSPRSRDQVKNMMSSLPSKYHKKMYQLDRASTAVRPQWHTSMIERSVHSLLMKWSKHATNLSIDASPRSSSGSVFAGYLGDLCMSFDRLAFHNIKVSGGGKIHVNGMRLSTIAFAPGAVGRFVRDNKILTEGRFSGKPFEFLAKDCILTQVT
eukprot:CAMPEP_0113298544 /NCGR_PEP_ID=MMETSP0010_2-20120614/942_1 /TAXON_ID=216773 ORGANISM="Corethron hystrix, Strain 308" /NCGR_SAMPLE_ID=MMETSP0010_2 /ASSEMBLY_ACC=CAM_ASM_000155 /LENGTH=189 /DNA_ID=CAMNT_0000151611 /DNA_START=837 /DNA_END=1406 /DNA_ORIENTATION=- /assembly_acc=CAM_ASM_000155